MLAIKIRKLVAENISISLLPIVSAKKSLDLLSLLLFPLPPTYECILSLSDETISPKINNIIDVNFFIVTEEWGLHWGFWWDGRGLPASRLQIRATPPLGQLQLWSCLFGDMRCYEMFGFLIFFITLAGRGRAIKPWYNSGKEGIVHCRPI